MSNLTEILPGGTELFHAAGWADRQRDSHDKAKRRLSQFCERA